MALAVVVGLALMLLRVLGARPSVAGDGIHRGGPGTPLLIQLFLIYYGLPEIGIR